MNVTPSAQCKNLPTDPMLTCVRSLLTNIINQTLCLLQCHTLHWPTKSQYYTMQNSDRCGYDEKISPQNIQKWYVTVHITFYSGLCAKGCPVSTIKFMTVMFSNLCYYITRARYSNSCMQPFNHHVEDGIDDQERLRESIQ